MTASFTVEIIDGIGELDHDAATWLQRTIGCVVRQLQTEGEISTRAASLTVNLVDEDTISRLHGEYFNDTSMTDVITFPVGDPWFEEESHLGDVVICGPVAAEQAADAQHTTLREIAFLAVHGVLHLAGFDDQTRQARDTMLTRQTELLEMCERSIGVTPA